MRESISGNARRPGPWVAEWRRAKNERFLGGRESRAYSDSQRTSGDEGREKSATGAQKLTDLSDQRVPSLKSVRIISPEGSHNLMHQ